MASRLKSLMKAKQFERATTAKIESPLAKYNNLGQLICAACKIIIKSDSLWNSHCAGAPHRQALLALKENQLKRKREEEAGTTSVAKKPKKNVPEEPPQVEMVIEPELEPVQEIIIEKPKPTAHDIPDGFFDDSRTEISALAQLIATEVSTTGNYRTHEEITEEQQALQDLKKQHEVEEKEEGEVVDVVELHNEVSLFPMEQGLPNAPKQVDVPTVKSESNKNIILKVETQTFTAMEHIDTNETIKVEKAKDEMYRNETMQKLNALKQKAQAMKAAQPATTPAAAKPVAKKPVVVAMEEDDTDDEEDMWRSGSIL